MTVDLRSDTLTKPTPGMLEAMFSAKVGDDVYGEDPSINELEARTAAYFGMEAGLFCPSGTMTNQIGIKVCTQPLDEVICFKGAHIYKYEGGGLFFNSGISAKLIDAPRGKLTAADVIEHINPEDVHFPQTKLIALENTVNRGGGACYPMEVIASISEVAKAHRLMMHLDGARIWNAIVARSEDPRSYSHYFDTISVCLSKGLGCPVGSVLLGSKALIRQAKRVRKAFGGGMRQAGYLAAAGLYALDHHIDRLAEDHLRAQAVGAFMATQPYVRSVVPVETNMVIFEMDQAHVPHFIEHCAAHGVRLGAMDKHMVRIVTHLDVDDQGIDRLMEVTKQFEPKI